MLSRICEDNTFEGLMKYIREIFIHEANTYQQFKMTILSLHLEDSQEAVIDDFMRMLENRVIKIK